MVDHFKRAADGSLFMGIYAGLDWVELDGGSTGVVVMTIKGVDHAAQVRTGSAELDTFQFAVPPGKLDGIIDALVRARDAARAKMA